MTRRHTKAQDFSLESHPDFAKLVQDFRAAALIDTGMVEQIGRAGAVLADKRGTLPPRSVAGDDENSPDLSDLAEKPS